jgi:hypothetical protein
MMSPTRSIFALGAAQHLDAHDTTSAGIVGDVEVCLHLNHGRYAFLVQFLPMADNARCDARQGRAR